MSFSVLRILCLMMAVAMALAGPVVDGIIDRWETKEYLANYDGRVPDHLRHVLGAPGVQPGLQQCFDIWQVF
jgi:hypothetical protein